MLISGKLSSCFRNLILAFVICVICGDCFGQESSSGPVRVRIFSLRNMTADSGKEFLSAAGVGGTVVTIPGTSALSVTGRADELVYASSIFRLVDS